MKRRKTTEAPIQPPLDFNVRVGKLDPRYLHPSDVDKIIGPHGDGAQEAFDRDLSISMAMDDDSDGDW